MFFLEKVYVQNVSLLGRSRWTVSPSPSSDHHQWSSKRAVDVELPGWAVGGVIGHISFSLVINYILVH
jgi:hypothetical protein